MSFVTLNGNQDPAPAPAGDNIVQLTPAAVRAARRLMAGAGALRLGAESGGCSGWNYVVGVTDDPAADDIVLDFDGVTVYVDRPTSHLLKGMELDYTSSFQESGFVFRNPNASRTCGCGKSFGVD